jgi:hypothetical protein
MSRAFAALAALAAALYLLVFKPWQRRWRGAAQRFFASSAGRSPLTVNESSEAAARADTLAGQVVDEVVRAFGFPLDGWQRRVLAPALQPLSRVFAQIALHFDEMVGSDGLGPAFGHLMAWTVRDAQITGGADTIPASGPLLILSNHPGAYDVPLIAMSLPRDDLKIIASTVPLIQSLPHFHQHVIEVTREAPDGMRGVRQAIRHLQSGGSLLILPTGIVDPDPDLLPGARQALASWSPSIELILRKAPQTQVVVVIVSGVLSPAWLRSPLVKIQRDDAALWRQRKLAEILQIIQQIVLPVSLLATPRVTFAPPVTLVDLTNNAGMHAHLVQRAQDLLTLHMALRAQPKPAAGAADNRARRFSKL